MKISLGLNAKFLLFDVTTNSDHCKETVTALRGMSRPREASLFCFQFGKAGDMQKSQEKIEQTVVQLFVINPFGTSGKVPLTRP